MKSKHSNGLNQAPRRIGINRVYYGLSVHGFHNSLFRVRIDGVEQPAPASMKVIGEILSEHVLSRIEIRILEEDGTMKPESPWIEVFFERWHERAVKAVFVCLGVSFVTGAVLLGIVVANRFGGGLCVRITVGLVFSVAATLLLVWLLIAGFALAYETHENLTVWLSGRRRSRYLRTAQNIPEDMKRAIEEGDVLVGMTKEQVHAAIGTPKQIEVKRADGADLTLWEYHWLFIKVGNELRRYDYVYFEGNTVRSAHWSGGFEGQPPPSLPRLPDAPSPRSLKQ